MAEPKITQQQANEKLIGDLYTGNTQILKQLNKGVEGAKNVKKALEDDNRK